MNILINDAKMVLATCLYCKDCGLYAQGEKDCIRLLAGQHAIETGHAVVIQTGYQYEISFYDEPEMTTEICTCDPEKFVKAGITSIYCPVHGGATEQQCKISEGMKRSWKYRKAQP